MSQGTHALCGEHRKKYDVTITLSLDCDDNCLQHEESDLIESKFIFGN